jgi:hypothetical protein
MTGLVLFAAAGCDLTASNTGPVDDAALNDPAAQEAVVNGMSRALSVALNWLAFSSGAAAREVLGTGTGVNNAFGVTRRMESGILSSALDETDPHWQNAQQARWIAEDGTRRMRRVLGAAFATSPTAARALLRVGFANRLLGENMCHAIFDGGPLEPRDAYFLRAEAAFTEALAIAQAAGQDSLVSAARAGRAAVRVWRGDWNGAVADAGAVPVGFRYVARYSAGEQELYNRIFWASANQPYRNSTVWSTWYESYYTTSGDQRVAWTTHATVPTMQTGRTWYLQQKYTTRDAPIVLASEREMRLILAEGALRAGDWPGAVQIINMVRGEVGVAPVAASDAASAWAALVRERGIELWLEARRLADLHRWLAEGVPGIVEDMTGRDTCFPIGQTELSTNPNLAGIVP